MAIEKRIHMIALIAPVDISGATKKGTYAVHFTFKKPISIPDRVAEHITAPKTFLSANIKGYEASANVPKARLIIKLGIHAIRSLFCFGKTIFARFKPAVTIMSPQRSIAPRKLNPVDSISRRIMGRIAAW